MDPPLEPPERNSAQLTLGVYPGETPHYWTSDQKCKTVK